MGCHTATSHSRVSFFIPHEIGELGLSYNHNYTNIFVEIGLLKAQYHSKCGAPTVLVLRMAHRIWKETKQQPGTAGPGNMPGCCLVSSHFLWAVLSTSTVVSRCPEFASTKCRHVLNLDVSLSLTDRYLSLWVSPLSSVVGQGQGARALPCPPLRRRFYFCNQNNFDITTKPGSEAYSIQEYPL